MAGTMHLGQQAATVAGARGAVTRLEGAPRYDLRGGPLGGDGPRGTAGRAHVRVRSVRAGRRNGARTDGFLAVCAGPTALGVSSSREADKSIIH